MVTKNKTGQKGKVKVGKLQLKKETVKHLAAEDLRKVKGGLFGHTKGCTGTNTK